MWPFKKKETPEEREERGRKLSLRIAEETKPHQALLRKVIDALPVGPRRTKAEALLRACQEGQAFPFEIDEWMERLDTFPVHPEEQKVQSEL